ncbi:membrane protein [Intrasporangium oryzae NRRL B-24470]|uniref:Membrane protein n=1 Tax=Intrasporangium oryzae NRRL B-24470 TaxID=1386089 RepID=W9G669_9MICO|nr:membrane protein [Intrasporangium oryzae]EWT01666.1 membrane protein [Intrasporangium oryzae NRRL B-24470]
MKLYADTTARRTRQLVADVLVLLWIGLWVWAGRQVHDTVARLGAPADSITSAGQSVQDALTGAGRQAGRIPAVGDDLQGWLDQAAGSGTTLKNAGLSMSSTIDTLATLLGWLTALLPIVLVVGCWGVLRWRFVRRATSAQRFIDATEDLDLFALRAMANQPMTALARISDDPAGAWRRRDADVIRALATLELRDQGLRPPAG